jgi:type 1 glutamine amidotransferase
MELKRKRTRLVLLAATLLVTAAGSVSISGTQGGVQPAGESAPRLKALIVSGGCCHDYTGQNKIVIDTVNRVLQVDWTVVVQGGRAGTARIPLYSDPDWYRGFDVVVHNECFTDVDDPDYIQRIAAAHQAGVPAMFFHCSLHSYRAAKVDDWRELMGATSFTHPEQDAPIRVRLTAQEHPIIKGLPQEWTTPIDELYVIEKFWPGAQALALASSPDSGNIDFPVVWTRDYRGTRVFATSLGHGGTWNEPIFHEILARGFQWAVGRPVTSLPPAQGRGAGRGRGGPGGPPPTP